MNEELMNKNTDLKDLFVQQKYEEMVDFLSGLQPEEAIELTLYNVEIVNKYYETERYDLLRQYLTFVAFSSFLYEFSAKTNLINEEQSEQMRVLFENVHEVIRG